MRFSERMGYRKVRDMLQIESVSEELLARIRNLVEVYLFDPIGRYASTSRWVNIRDGTSSREKFLWELFDSFFRTEIPCGAILANALWEKLWQSILGEDWYYIYDFLEFCIQEFPYDKQDEEHFVAELNRVLEEERAGYRITAGEIAPLTSGEEIDAIEKAIENGIGPDNPVALHLKRSLELLADHEEPDYRNSIKESVSAVESLCTKYAGEKTSLGKALKILEEDCELDLHPALLAAFNKLYGYASDKDGIRHSILEETDLALEDARFMLIVCSAFINYFRAKQAKQVSRPISEE